MGFFFTFACLASTLSLSVSGGSVEGRLAKSKMDSIYKPLQVTRAKLNEKEASKLALPSMETINFNLPEMTGEVFKDFKATPVIIQTTEEELAARGTQGSERLERRTWPLPPRYNIKQSRAYAILLDTYHQICPHTRNIRNFCNESRRGGNPERLGWNLVAELRAILNILLACLNNIKNAGNAPTPSGVPNGNSPTLADICRILFNIMCEIRECFQLIRSLCAQYGVVRTVCSDTLRQIAECLCNIMVQCGLQVGNISAGLSQLFIAVPNFFINIDFGFSGIPRILRANASFSAFSLRL